MKTISALFTAIILVFLFTFTLSSCGGDEAVQPKQPDPVVVNPGTGKVDSMYLQTWLQNQTFTRKSITGNANNSSLFTFRNIEKDNNTGFINGQYVVTRINNGVTNVDPAVNFQITTNSKVFKSVNGYGAGETWTYVSHDFNTKTIIYELTYTTGPSERLELVRK